MLLKDFDYELPEELIALYPPEKRDEARLLVADRAGNSIEHRRFYDIIDYLNEGDCLVLNDSRVIPARIYGRKSGTGAVVETLLTKNIDGDTWEAMVRPGKRLKQGAEIVFSDEAGRRLSAVVTGLGADGVRYLKFSYDGVFRDRLRELGQMPLPPYINRAAEEFDSEMYQTVYCRNEGSVASPTAGLHFTDELLERIRAKGVNTAFVTLHVGIGTFRPVKCDVIEDHKMHTEHYEITDETADIINGARSRGGRVIAVGTTSARTLESAAGENGMLNAGIGDTDIFIYPGYRFKLADCLITNFHLPRSTLLMLVSAFYDREKILEIYKEAVVQKYRFFSYGDAMLLI